MMLQMSGTMEGWVKLVYVAETPASEIEVAARCVAEMRPDLPLVLQPCTPFARVRTAPPPELGLEFQALSSRFVDDVRVIPQVHRFLELP